MASIVKKLIEYEGVADSIPSFDEEYAAIKQFNVEENLCIPAVKPDIEQIIKVKSKLIIKRTQVIETPVSKSLEEQVLTGWKAIVEGEIKQIIQYVADEKKQSVHAAHFNVPFSSFVILPPTFEAGMNVNVVGYIEDIFIEQICKRKLFKNTTILLVAGIK